MNPQKPDTIATDNNVCPTATDKSVCPTPQTPKPTAALDAATVRFCGDSGDGMQLAGTQLTSTSALVGNDVATFPDFPAEIRARAGPGRG